MVQQASVKLCYPAVWEACPAYVSSTTTMQIALGDALSLVLMAMRGFSRERMKRLDPDGSFGMRLTTISDITRDRSTLPLVSQDVTIIEVASMMTSSGLGIAGVIDVTGWL